VEVAMALNLEAEKAINYYHQYFMLLGITEFTKAYLQSVGKISLLNRSLRV
jgi:hypothetical protein